MKRNEFQEKYTDYLVKTKKRPKYAAISPDDAEELMREYHANSVCRLYEWIKAYYYGMELVVAVRMKPGMLDFSETSIKI